MANRRQKESGNAECDVDSDCPSCPLKCYATVRLLHVSIKGFFSSVPLSFYGFQMWTSGLFFSFPLLFFLLNHADYSHLILYIFHKQANTGHKLDPL